GFVSEHGGGKRLTNFSARGLLEAFRLHSFPLLELLYSPRYAAARQDPRILDLLRRQGEYRGAASSPARTVT
ncbi:MAG TPA: hypothetical protein VEG66_03155, partial [Thermoplasmata archaeon]|nr:hypothetical protein [Thermoplasmata archaeon]